MDGFASAVLQRSKSCCRTCCDKSLQDGCCKTVANSTFADTPQMVLALQAAGRWSARWASRFVQRHAHCMRDSADVSFEPALIAERDAEWLRDQRRPFVPKFSIRANAWTLDAGRTATRASAGPPSMRWEESLPLATETAALLESTNKKSRKPAVQRFLARAGI